MPDHSSTSSDLSQDDLYDAVPPLPTNRYHLEQLSRDVSKVIDSAEDRRKALLTQLSLLESVLKRSESGRPVTAKDLNAVDLQDLPQHPIPTKEIELYKQFSLAASYKLQVACNRRQRYEQMSDQICRLQRRIQPEELEKLVDLGKEIIEFTDDGLYEPFRELRRRIYEKLEPPEQEGPPQSSRSTPEDDDALEEDDDALEDQKLEKYHGLTKSERNDYLSYFLAIGEKGKDPTDPQSHVGKELTYQEAYEFLETYDFSDTDLGVLWNYKLPACFDTWRKRVGIARKALGEQKNQPRGGRLGDHFARSIRDR